MKKINFSIDKLIIFNLLLFNEQKYSNIQNDTFKISSISA